MNFASEKLSASLDILKTSLLLSTAANVILILLVSTLFEGTDGFCDAEASEARKLFRSFVLFQLLVNCPSFVYFHKTDKEFNRSEADDTSSGVAPNSGRRQVKRRSIALISGEAQR